MAIVVSAAAVVAVEVYFISPQVEDNTIPIQETEPPAYSYTDECNGMCVGDIVEINFSHSQEYGERHAVTEILLVDSDCRVCLEDGQCWWVFQVKVLNLTNEERNAFLLEKQSDIETILTNERFLTLQVGDEVIFTEKAREVLRHVDYRFEAQTVEGINQEYETIKIQNDWFSRYWFRTIDS